MFDRLTIHIAMLVWGCIFNLAAAVCTMLLRNFNAEKRKWMLLMQLSTVCLLGFDALSWIYQGDATPLGLWMTRVSNFAEYLLIFAILIFFNCYLCRCLYESEPVLLRRRSKIVLGIAAVGILLILISLKTGIYYSIDDQNVYHRGVIYPVAVLLPIAGLLLDLSMLIQQHKSISPILYVSMLVAILLPVAAAVFQWMYYGYTLLSTSVGVSMIVMFLVLTVEQNRELGQLSRSNAETTERLEIATTLNRCVTELSGGTDISTSIDNLLEVIGHYFAADRTYIFEIDYDKNVINNTHEYTRDQVSVEKDKLQQVPLDVVAVWMDQFRRSRVYYIPDVEQERGLPSYEMLVEQNITRLLAVPLMRDGTIVGFMGVDNPRAHYADATLLSSIQFFVSNSLSTKVQQEQLRYLSFRDMLTNLYNRNQYIRVMENCAKQPLQNVGAAYLDLNGLKEVNDSYGHEAGDRMIRRAASVLSKAYPEQAYRVGGDEFVLIVPDTSEQDFMNKMLEIRNGMQEKQVSISMGAVWRENTDDIEEMLKDADHMMYLEKADYHLQRRNKEEGAS